MKESHGDWEQHFEAARRKIAIASFHVDSLQKELNGAPGTLGALPPIPIQAHFEGVVVSVIAAIDQVAQAANSALNLHLRPDIRVRETMTRLSQTFPEIALWFENPLGLDLRRIRTRMAHYSYAKMPQGLCWTVEYGLRLQELFPQIEKELTSSTRLR